MNNPFSRVLSGLAAPASNPEHMLLYAIVGVLESYFSDMYDEEEETSIVAVTQNPYADTVAYLTQRFGDRSPVVAYAKTLWARKLLSRAF